MSFEGKVLLGRRGCLRDEGCFEGVGAREVGTVRRVLAGFEWWGMVGGGLLLGGMESWCGLNESEMDFFWGCALSHRSGLRRFQENHSRRQMIVH